MVDPGFGDPIDPLQEEPVDAQPAYDYETDRAHKQQYLVDNIVNPGYDATTFAAYMSEQRGN